VTSEDPLSNFSLEELLSLMVKTMDELLAIPKDQRHDDTARQKRKQMEVIQRMINSKRLQS